MRGTALQDVKLLNSNFEKNSDGGAYIDMYGDGDTDQFFLARESSFIDNGSGKFSDGLQLRMRVAPGQVAYQSVRVEGSSFEENEFGAGAHFFLRGEGDKLVSISDSRFVDNFDGARFDVRGPGPRTLTLGDMTAGGANAIYGNSVGPISRAPGSAGGITAEGNYWGGGPAPMMGPGIVPPTTWLATDPTLP